MKRFGYPNLSQCAHLPNINSEPSFLFCSQKAIFLSSSFRCSAEHDPNLCVAHHALWPPRDRQLCDWSLDPRPLFDGNPNHKSPTTQTKQVVQMVDIICHMQFSSLINFDRIKLDINVVDWKNMKKIRKKNMIVVTIYDEDAKNFRRYLQTWGSSLMFK